MTLSFDDDDDEEDQASQRESHLEVKFFSFKTMWYLVRLVIFFYNYLISVKNFISYACLSTCVHQVVSVCIQNVRLYNNKY